MQFLASQNINTVLKENLTSFWEKLANLSDAWRLEQNETALFMTSPVKIAYFNMVWTQAHVIQPPLPEEFRQRDFLHILTGATSENVNAQRQTLGKDLKNFQSFQLPSRYRLTGVKTLDERKTFAQALETLFQSKIPELDSAVDNLCQCSTLYLFYENDALVNQAQVFIDDQNTAGLYMLNQNVSSSVTMAQALMNRYKKKGSVFFLCPVKINHFLFKNRDLIFDTSGTLFTAETILAEKI